MRNADCVAFLKWCLPRLGLRYPGFRKVRGTVCKRVRRRLAALGLADLDAYRARLAADKAEWAALDALCRIPISRFWRDRAVFDCLAREVLPSLTQVAVARGDPRLRAWSAGSASGEEPYGLRLAWSLRAGPRFPGLRLEVVATDADPAMLTRAAAGRYRRGSLRDLPPELIDTAFDRRDDRYDIRVTYRRDVAFVRQDVRHVLPEGPFDLVLCRNLAFTYFDEPGQRALLARICTRLRPGAALVIGRKETLPEPHPDLVRWAGAAPVYRFVPVG